MRRTAGDAHLKVRGGSGPQTEDEAPPQAPKKGLASLLFSGRLSPNLGPRLNCGPGPSLSPDPGHTLRPEPYSCTQTEPGSCSHTEL